MKKNLYKVLFVHQETGSYTEQYVFAENMSVVEDEFADIISIAVCNFIELPEELK